MLARVYRATLSPSPRCRCHSTSLSWPRRARGAARRIWGSSRAYRHPFDWSIVFVDVSVFIFLFLLPRFGIGFLFGIIILIVILSSDWSFSAASTAPSNYCPHGSAAIASAVTCSSCAPCSFHGQRARGALRPVRRGPEPSHRPRALCRPSRWLFPSEQRRNGGTRVDRPSLRPRCTTPRRLRLHPRTVSARAPAYAERLGQPGVRSWRTSLSVVSHTTYRACASCMQGARWCTCRMVWSLADTLSREALVSIWTFTFYVQGRHDHRGVRTITSAGNPSPDRCRPGGRGVLPRGASPPVPGSWPPSPPLSNLLWVSSALASQAYAAL